MEPKLFYVVVTNTYSEAAATSFENMVAALEKKYGGPPYETSKAQYTTRYLHWAWAPSGDLISLSEKHPCAQRQLAAVGADASPTGLGGVPSTLVDAGCAAVVHVTLGVRDGVVLNLEVIAQDAFHFHESKMRTEAFVKDFQENYEQQVRDQAAQRKAPDL